MFIKAVRLSFPEQLGPNANLNDMANHLKSYDSEQLHGLINKNKIEEYLKLQSNTNLQRIVTSLGPSLASVSPASGHQVAPRSSGEFQACAGSPRGWRA